MQQVHLTSCYSLLLLVATTIGGGKTWNEAKLRLQLEYKTALVNCGVVVMIVVTLLWCAAAIQLVSTVKWHKERETTVH